MLERVTYEKEDIEHDQRNARAAGDETHFGSLELVCKFQEKIRLLESFNLKEALSDLHTKSSKWFDRTVKMN